MTKQLLVLIWSNVSKVLSLVLPQRLRWLPANLRILSSTPYIVSLNNTCGLTQPVILLRLDKCIPAYWKQGALHQ